MDRRIVKTYRIRPILSERADAMVKLAGGSRSEYDERAIEAQVKRDEQEAKRGAK
jgi:hypothetical protein